MRLLFHAGLQFAYTIANELAPSASPDLFQIPTPPRIAVTTGTYTKQHELILYGNQIS
jgi:hypothetical protein